MRIHAFDLELTESDLSRLIRQANGPRFELESLTLHPGRLLLGAQVRVALPLVGERWLKTDSAWGFTGKDGFLIAELHDLKTLISLPSGRAMVVEKIARLEVLQAFTTAKKEALHFDTGRLMGRFGLAGEPRIEAIDCSTAGLRIKLGGNLHHAGDGES